MSTGCGRYDCEGVWTYDRKEWADDEYRAMMQVPRAWNEFSGRTLVDIQERTPANLDRCRISPGKPKDEDGKLLAGQFHATSDGGIEINASRLRTFVPSSEYSRYLYAVILHEVGHGLGMDHVDDPSNIMFPSQGYTKWGKQDWQECLDRGICTQEGTGPQP